MLIEFSVSNFRSLRDRQTLSLVKAKGNELSETNTFSVPIPGGDSLLRSAVIYGPNASGKSNLLAALKVMALIVLRSATRGSHGDKLPVVPFRLAEDTSQAPSVFEVSCVADKVLYRYGFSASEERIHDEWLLAYPKGRPQRWFERHWREKSRTYKWKLGDNLVGEKQLWKAATRDNALFLSTAVQLNSESLQAVHDWFHKKLHIAGSGKWNSIFSTQLCEDEKQRERIVNFLCTADLGIDNVKIEKTAFDVSALPDDMPESMKREVAKDMKDTPFMKDVQFANVKTLHKSGGRDVRFDLNEDESEGTKKMFALAGPWIDSLDNGSVACIDELHNSLHPDLSRFLVSLFHSSEHNRGNAQLIFTTHDTSLLDLEVFRRDQIWFIDKDKEQTSNLYPLTDFKLRKGSTNLKLAYHSGRYGALPVVRSQGKFG